MAEITEAQKKAVEKLFERFINLFSAVGEAESKGFFIEAIVRIDLVLNLALSLMLHLSYKSDEEEKTTETIEEVIGDRYFPDYIPKILEKKGLITEQHLKRIEKFRSFRNTMVHNPFGDWEILKQRNQFNVENILAAREKELFKEECKKGRVLVTDLVNHYLDHRFNGEIKGAKIEWKLKDDV